MIIISRFCISIVFLVLSSNDCISQEINKKVTDHNGREKLLGKVTKDAFTNNSFANWFIPNHKNYKVNNEILEPIKKELATYKILAFMGTWCGDSKREVPRFYKVLETVDYPIKNLTMVTVDNTKPNYKKSPTGEEVGYHIIKVPTFIFLKNGKEINRIVESPIKSLEQDIAAIVNGEKYVPKYSTAISLPQD